MKLECLYVEACLPDYWTGHHLAHICAPVDNNTTLSSLKEDLITEINMEAVMGDYEITQREGWYEAATKAINAITATSDKPFDVEAYEDEDYEYNPVMAYFVFREV